VTRFAFSIDIAAPREHVFDLWADLDRLTAWTDGLTKVTEVNGAGDLAGSKYRLWFGSLDERVDVLFAHRPYYHRTRARFGTFKLETSVTFENVDGATRMREAIHVKGLKGRLWAWLLSRGSFRGSFRRELDRFAQTCERDELKRPVPVMVNTQYFDDEPVLVAARPEVFSRPT
jgi:diadenosine tetraphosphatase ApaH/serine/threonine PP2A family protein phosphatase